MKLAMIKQWVASKSASERPTRELLMVPITSKANLYKELGAAFVELIKTEDVTAGEDDLFDIAFSDTLRVSKMMDWEAANIDLRISELFAILQVPEDIQEEVYETMQ
jgi:hypothetical protein